MTSEHGQQPAAWFARSSRRGRLAWTAAFFLAFYLVGLASYRDYGISWDETTNRSNGMITLMYVGELFFPEKVERFKDVHQFEKPLSEYYDRTYGVAFEAPLAGLERALGMKNPREIYLFRHLVTFLVCSLGVWAVWRLAERRFADWRIGLLAALILVLSPRLYAESFYNGKDAVFMALFALATSTAVSFVLQPSARSALLHAAASAVAIDVRIVGIVLPATTAGFFFLRMLRGQLGRRALTPLAVYLAVLCLLVVALWPYLWPAPGTNFLHALASMASFPWDDSVLYFGELIKAPELPWHYLFVWIAISTPIFYLVLFGAGALTVLVRLARARLSLWQDDGEFQDLLFLALAVGPLLGVTALDSVLYDGWRQLYFVYPAFVLVAVRGWVALSAWRPAASMKAWPAIVVLSTLACLAQVAWWMWSAHPHQNVYVNALAGRDVKRRFDLDYWGLTNRAALEYILAHDERPLIKVAPGSWTYLNMSLLLLEGPARARLSIVKDEAEADYVVTNYRCDLTDHAAADESLALFHEIEVGGEVVSSTYVRSRVH